MSGEIFPSSLSLNRDDEETDEDRKERDGIRKWEGNWKLGLFRVRDESGEGFRNGDEEGIAEKYRFFRREEEKVMDLRRRNAMDRRKKERKLQRIRVFARETKKE